MVKFCRLTLGGSALGLVSGIIFSPLMKIMNNENLVVVFSFIATYLTFFIAESEMIGFGVSGILAVVVLGLYLGANLRPSLNPHYTHTLHSVWSFAQFTMETLLFLLTGGYIGIFVAEKKLGVTGYDVGKMIGFNFILLFIRFLVIALFWPIMNCIGDRITWKEYIIMGWSGLRGAIALAIGLVVSLDYRYAEIFRNLSILYISGVIIFTVLIQGMSLKLVMRIIGYNKMSTNKQKLYKGLRRRFFLNLLEKSENLRANKEISYQVCWPSIYKIFNFPKYILDFANLESGEKPLMLDYDYRRDVDAMVELHVDRLDHMISDDEIDTYNDMVNFVREQEFDTWQQNHTESQSFLINQEDSVLSVKGKAYKVDANQNNLCKLGYRVNYFSTNDHRRGGEYT
jgi:NhaP-type Na+/H+ or K+/H+ antiporter